MRNCAIIHPLHLELETAPYFLHLLPAFESTNSLDLFIKDIR